jgi:hypothetical protein
VSLRAWGNSPRNVIRKHPSAESVIHSRRSRMIRCAVGICDWAQETTDTTFVGILARAPKSARVARALPRASDALAPQSYHAMVASS